MRAACKSSKICLVSRGTCVYHSDATVESKYIGIIDANFAGLAQPLPCAKLSNWQSHDLASVSSVNRGNLSGDSTRYKIPYMKRTWETQVLHS